MSQERRNRTKEKVQSVSENKSVDYKKKGDHYEICKM